MKIISLNTWGGRAGRDLILNFFRENKDVDVFCLQEIWSGGQEIARKYNELGDLSDVMYDFFDIVPEILSDYNYYFRPHVGDHYGLCIFVKKTIPVEEEGEYFVHKDKDFTPDDSVGIGGHARNLQFVKIGSDNPITIWNFHGLWNGQGKSDTQDRITQSKNITKALENTTGPHVLIGDFNLLPETKSVKIIENSGMKNMITEYGIKSTRTSFYTKELKFADYAFVSPEVEDVNFEVLPDEVSDHSALLLEITP